MNLYTFLLEQDARPQNPRVDDVDRLDCGRESLTRQGTISGRKVRAIFDFDWTIVNENSDAFIFKKLAPDLLQLLTTSKAQWTDLMDHCVGLLHGRNVTAEQIEHCFDDIPFAPEMIEALRLIAAHDSPMEIVSDANSVFIDCILKRYGLRGLFSRVTTNPAFFDAAGRLHIARLIKETDAPHGCTLCAANICKGALVAAGSEKRA